VGKVATRCGPKNFQTSERTICKPHSELGEDGERWGNHGNCFAELLLRNLVMVGAGGGGGVASIDRSGGARGALKSLQVPSYLKFWSALDPGALQTVHACDKAPFFFF
jgi:hypothetical protein